MPVPIPAPSPTAAPNTAATQPGQKDSAEEREDGSRTNATETRTPVRKLIAWIVVAFETDLPFESGSGTIVRASHPFATRIPN